MNRATRRWIEERIVLLNARDLGNSLQEVGAKLAEFNEYRTRIKPPRYVRPSRVLRRRSEM